MASPHERRWRSSISTDAKETGKTTAPVCSSEPQIPLQDVYFLVTDFLLRTSPCQDVADLLKSELERHGLFGMAVDWQGQSRAATYADLRARHKRISSTHLLRILESGVSDRAKGSQGGGKSISSSAKGTSLLTWRNPKSRSADNRRKYKEIGLPLVQKFQVGRSACTVNPAGNIKQIQQERRKKIRQLASVEKVLARCRDRSVNSEITITEKKAQEFTPIEASVGDQNASKAALGEEALDVRKEDEPTPNLIEEIKLAAIKSAAIGPENAPSSEFVTRFRTEDGTECIKVIWTSRTIGLTLEPAAAPVGKDGQDSAELYYLHIKQIGAQTPTTAANSVKLSALLKRWDIFAALNGVPLTNTNAKDLLLYTTRQLAMLPRPVVLTFISTSEKGATQLSANVKGQNAFQHSAAQATAEARASRHYKELLCDIENLDEEIEKGSSKAADAGLYSVKRYDLKNCFNLLRKRELGNPLPLTASPPTYLYSRIRRLKVLSGHYHMAAYCCNFDQLGQIIITGADDRLVKMWCAKTGELLYTLRGHQGHITDLAVNKTNTLLATASDDKVVRVWEIKTGYPVAVLTGHTAVVNYVKFDGITGNLVSVSDDGSCRVWYLEQDQQGSSDAGPVAVVHGHVSSLSLLHSNPQSNKKTKVNCVSLSPIGPYVAVGCDDGVGRIWSLKKPTPQATLSTTPPLTMATVASTEISEQDALMDRLLAKLKGHTSGITNIFFSNKGDRIASASMKDGTARVWFWQKGFSCINNHVLHAGMGAPSGPSGQSRGGPRGAIRGPNPSVDMVLWTCDDRRVVTHQCTKPKIPSLSGECTQAIKVWDPDTGKLVHVLGTETSKNYGHIKQAFVMAGHPSDWRLLMTAGYDGRCFLWDVEKGVPIKGFENLRAPQQLQIPNAFLDGAFSPCGETFILTDNLGRLSVFSTGEGERFRVAPPEQYFASDYQLIVVDQNMNVVDATTQMPPHLMPRGPLINTMGQPYEHQPPNRNTLRGDAQSANQDNEVLRKARIAQTTQLERQMMNELAPSSRYDLDDNVAVYIETNTQSSRPTNLGNGTMASVLHSPFARRLNGEPVSASEPPFLGRRPSQSLTSPSVMRTPSATTVSTVATPTANSQRQTMSPAPVFPEDLEEEDDPADEDFTLNAEEEEEEEAGSDFSSDNSSKSSVHVKRKSPRKKASRATSSRIRSTRSSGNRSGLRKYNSSDESDLDLLSEEADDDEEDRAMSRAKRSKRQQKRKRVASFSSAGSEEDPGRSTAERSLSASSKRRQTRASTWEAEETEPSRRRVQATSDGSEDGRDVSGGQSDIFDHSIVVDGGTVKHIEEQSDAKLPRLVCALCTRGNDDGLLKLPGSALGPHPLILRPVKKGKSEKDGERVWIHDMCAICSPQAYRSSEDDKWYNVGKEVRRGRLLECQSCKKKGATIGCFIKECKASYHYPCASSLGLLDSETQFFCPKHRPKPSKQKKKEVKKYSGKITPTYYEEEAPEMRFGKQYDRDWLCGTHMESRYRYVPQVGDQVVYLPQGHQRYLQTFPSRLIPPWQEFPAGTRWPAVRCQIERIWFTFPTAEEYEHSSSIVAWVTLLVTGTPSFGSEQERDNFYFQQYTRDRAPLVFDVTFRKCDYPDFLVLEDRYALGVRWRWHTGEKVRVMYAGDGDLDEAFLGIVQSQATRDPEEWPKSDWESLEIKWLEGQDTGSSADIELVHPWEVEPDDDETAAMFHEKHEASDEYKHLQNCRLSIQESQRFLTGLDEIAASTDAEQFRQPVPADVAGYLVVVAVPMDLSLIRSRVENGYYRQVEAIMEDAQLIHTNCETFNQPGSDIVRRSRVISDAIISLVRSIRRASPAPEVRSDRLVLLPARGSVSSSGYAGNSSIVRTVPSSTPPSMRALVEASALHMRSAEEASSSTPSGVQRLSTAITASLDASEPQSRTRRITKRRGNDSSSDGEEQKSSDSLFSDSPMGQGQTQEEQSMSNRRLAKTARRATTAVVDDNDDEADVITRTRPTRRKRSYVDEDDEESEESEEEEEEESDDDDDDDWGKTSKGHRTKRQRKQKIR